MAIMKSGNYYHPLLIDLIIDSVEIREKGGPNRNLCSVDGANRNVVHVSSSSVDATRSGKVDTRESP